MLLCRYNLIDVIVVMLMDLVSVMMLRSLGRLIFGVLGTLFRFSAIGEWSIMGVKESDFLPHTW